MKRTCSMAILLAWAWMAWPGIAAVEGDADQADRGTIHSLPRSVAEARVIHNDDDARREKCDAQVAELARLRAELKELNSRRISLENWRSSLQAWIDESREVLAAQRVRWIAAERMAAVGEHHDSLTTADRRQFKQVEITAVTDAGIEIRHATGTARIRCEYLGRDWWERFQWSHDAQERLLAKERLQGIRFGQAEAERQRVALDLKRQRQEIAAARPTITTANTSAAYRRYASLLHEPPRTFGTGTIWRRYDYGWPRYGLYPYRYYNVAGWSNSCPQSRRAATPVRSGVWRVSGGGGMVPVGIPSSQPCQSSWPVEQPIVKPSIPGR